MNIFDKKNSTGFTLIEVAIVLLILGFILAASLTPLSSQIERAKIRETDAILKDAMESLYGFAATFGRLPCPAMANSGGQEQPVGGGDCTGVHGFLPGRTLGLSGEYNQDGLLLDAWGNPIRYSITQNDTFDIAAPVADTNFADFTTNNEMKIVTVGLLSPDFFVCTLAGNINGAICQNGDTLANNAVAVIMSLGKDGNEATSAIGVNGADQIENSGEVNLLAGPSGISYSVGNDRVFVFHDYKETTTGNGIFNDQLIWMSPFTLYDRMYKANKLP